MDERMNELCVVCSHLTPAQVKQRGVRDSGQVSSTSTRPAIADPTHGPCSVSSASCSQCGACCGGMSRASPQKKSTKSQNTRSMWFFFGTHMTYLLRVKLRAGLLPCSNAAPSLNCANRGSPGGMGMGAAPPLDSASAKRRLMSAAAVGQSKAAGRQ
jgi:hypothetical protein